MSAYPGLLLQEACEVTKTVSGEGRTVPDPRVLVLHPTTLRVKAKARASLHPAAPPHPTKLYAKISPLHKVPKSWSSGARLFGPEPWLCLGSDLDPWPWPSHSTSLRLCFLTWGGGRYLPSKVVMRTKQEHT